MASRGTRKKSGSKTKSGGKKEKDEASVVVSLSGPGERSVPVKLHVQHDGIHMIRGTSNVKVGTDAKLMLKMHSDELKRVEEAQRCAVRTKKPVQLVVNCFNDASSVRAEPSGCFTFGGSLSSGGSDSSECYPRVERSSSRGFSFGARSAFDVCAVPPTAARSESCRFTRVGMCKDTKNLAPPEMALFLTETKVIMALRNVFDKDEKFLELAAIPGEAVLEAEIIALNTRDGDKFDKVFAKYWKPTVRHFLDVVKSDTRFYSYSHESRIAALNAQRRTMDCKFMTGTEKAVDKLLQKLTVLRLPCPNVCGTIAPMPFEKFLDDYTESLVAGESKVNGIFHATPVEVEGAADFHAACMEALKTLAKIKLPDASLEGVPSLEIADVIYNETAKDPSKQDHLSYALISDAFRKAKFSTAGSEEKDEGKEALWVVFYAAKKLYGRKHDNDLVGKNGMPPESLYKFLKAMAEAHYFKDAVDALLTGDRFNIDSVKTVARELKESAGTETKIDTSSDLSGIFMNVKVIEIEKFVDEGIVSQVLSDINKANQGDYTRRAHYVAPSESKTRKPDGERRDRRRR